MNDRHHPDGSDPPPDATRPGTRRPGAPGERRSEPAARSAAQRADRSAGDPAPPPDPDGAPPSVDDPAPDGTTDGAATVDGSAAAPAAPLAPPPAPSSPPSGAQARAARAPVSTETAPAPPRRGSGPLRIALLLALLAGAAAGLWVRTQLTPPAAVGEARAFEVEPGWGATRVAAELERAELIRDARVFRYWLRWRGLDRDLGEGLYDLAPTMGAFEVAEALAAGGRPRTTRVVIPEGFRLQDVTARLAANQFGDEGALLALVREPTDLRPPGAPEGATLEGYLFPASYELRLDASGERVLAAMLARFDDELTDEVRAELDAAGLSVHDWVTLASMVQAEAAGPDEMPTIAGVFRNRLDLGMPLQSDPTVAYGLGKDLPELNVFAGDFETDHPWNTYTRPGLPIGPIGNPGREALRAVLDPQRLTVDGEPWLYFLHGVDNGQPVFRPNISLADHNRDVERYLR